MARRVFYSFHYKPDCFRAAQVRNMGVVDGNIPAADNEWETITRGGDAAIQRWIDNQLDGKSCAIVLIGTATSTRKWIKYEIKQAWESGKGLMGIYIHRLKDIVGNQVAKGANPFEAFNVSGTSLSSIAPAHNPPFADSKEAYAYIKENLSGWIEEAIRIREQY